jgi:hypothetical protein
MNDRVCIICSQQCTFNMDDAKAVASRTPVHDCPRCGAYIPAGPVQERLKQMIQCGTVDPSVLSHRIRRSQNAGPFLIVLDELPALLNLGPLPTPREQCEALILWIGQNQKSPEEWAAGATLAELGAVVGARISRNEGALNWLLRELEPKGLFKIHPTGIGGHPGFILTMEGWDLYEDLRRKIISSKNAFMAMKFGDEELERVYRDCFKVAASDAGFKLQLINEGQGAGLIDNQIRAAIRSSKFVIADLTHDNNGAYFEAGFGEGLGLDVIYTCKADKFEKHKTHFDTNHMFTIPWDPLDLESARKNLTATIRITLPTEATMAADG